MPHDLTNRLARRVKLKDAHIITRMADIADGLTDVIRLGRGDPDLDTPPHIIAAGQEALAEGATHYTHPLGHPAAAAGHRRQHPRLWRGRLRAREHRRHARRRSRRCSSSRWACSTPATRSSCPARAITPIIRRRSLPARTVVNIRTTMETNFTLHGRDGARRTSRRSRRSSSSINPNNPTGTVTPARRGRADRRGGEGARPDRHLRRDLRPPHLRQPHGAAGGRAAGHVRAHDHALGPVEGLRHDGLAHRLLRRAADR